MSFTEFEPWAFSLLLLLQPFFPRFESSARRSIRPTSLTPMSICGQAIMSLWDEACNDFGIQLCDKGEDPANIAKFCTTKHP